MSLRIKICGLTNLDDALAAAGAGADALGFVFCESSPRYITAPRASAIIEALPPFVTKVGLFVNASEEFIRDVLGACALDAVQFHGDESPEFCRTFKLEVKRSVIKAFRIRDEASIKALASYNTDAWLLDSYVEGQRGGTGHSFNWDLARAARRCCPRLILAGGLTPATVADAVRQVRPYAVDVSSGVESSPGRKDRVKVSDFIQAARAADAN